MTEKFEELVTKLKEIFQLDKPELDFGIYRIMHAREKEIKDFLEHHLEEKVKAAIAGNAATEKATLQAELEEKIKQVKALGLDPCNVPAIQEIRDKIAALGGSEDEEASVYAHLLAFFSRYYDTGDFISKRRYKDGVYAIPYSGEEVKLHWANADQYYTKSGESFTNYSFKLDDGAKVHFKLVTAETAKDNIKDNECVRCFVLWNPAIRETVDDEEYADSLPAKILEEKDGELYIYFQYLKFKKGAKQADFTKEAREKIFAEIGTQQLLAKFNLTALSPTEKEKNRTIFDKHFTTYTAKNTSDYFIHKDLKGFLTRELDFYIKNEMMHLDDLQNINTFREIERNLRQIQAVRLIASELITFMAQLEDFQKKLWLKKKFVVQCDYCITMDRVPEELHAEVFANEAQIAEWKRLGVEVDPKDVDLTAIDSRMIDTKFFGETFKSKLLAAIPDLDEQCDGVLIHSENFQALKLLKGKHKEEVKCIYADPPYNTSASEILYKNNYKHSAWLSLLHNEIDAGIDLLGKDGIQCTTIDDVEQSKLSLLLENIYGETPYAVNIRIKPSGRPIPNGFALSHEYALFSKKMSSTQISRLKHSEEQRNRYRESDEKGAFLWELLRKAGSNSFRENRPTMYYPFAVNTITKSVRVPEMKWNEGEQVYELLEEIKSDEVLVYPLKDDGKDGRWYYGIERAIVEQSEIKAVFESGKYQLYRRRRSNDGVQPTTSWIDAKYSATEHGTDLLKRLFGEQESFSYPKSIFAVIDCLNVSGLHSKALVLDYFGGSGTTAHATIALNREDGGKRKYILVEMGDHFDTVLKPRTEKIVYSPDWKDGKPVDCVKGISHCFKYMTLESYEDALNNIELKNHGELFSGAMKDEYLLGYMLEIEAKGSIINTDDFKHPFDYQLKIAVDSSGASEKRKVDLIETFNYLIGLRVAQYVRQIDKGFAFLDGTLPSGEKAFIFWRDCEKVTDDDLNKLLARYGIKPGTTEYDVIYVNGDHAIANVTLGEENGGKTLKVRQIENVFIDKMFAETK